MIHIKTAEQIEAMIIGGKILSQTMWEVCRAVRPGVTELELDQLADRLITKKGGFPGFKKVKGYHHATCICTNDVVVHGIPTQRKLKVGDIVDIDCGVFYGGLHTDMCETVAVGKIPPDVEKFLQVGKLALAEGVKQAKVGNRIGHISKTIQDIIEKDNHYSVTRSLIGHGVGRELHEDPEVPGFLDQPIEKTPLLKVGMTIAIEVIYNMGGSEVVYSANRDGWTIVTEDSSLSAVFERSIAITKNGTRILTP